MSTLQERIELDRLRTLTDRRVQYRNMKRPDEHPSHLTKEVLDDNIRVLNDSIDNVDVVDTKQPAIGLFSAERLAFVQQTYQRYTKDARR